MQTDERPGDDLCGDGDWRALRRRQVVLVIAFALVLLLGLTVGGVFVVTRSGGSSVQCPKGTALAHDAPTCVTSDGRTVTPLDD